MATKRNPRKKRTSQPPTDAERRRALADLRVLAHPLRLRLFEIFADRPRTTMEVAALLGEPPTRLYHHVNALERAGLIRLRETRPIRGTVAKYYQSVAEPVKAATGGALRRDPKARQSLRATAGAVFAQAREDLLACLHDTATLTPPGPLLLRMIMVAPPAKVTALRKRLLRLVEELRTEYGADRDERQANPDDQRWAMTLAFAPSGRPQPNGAAER